MDNTSKKQYIDESQIIKALQLLKPNKELFEVRIIRGKEVLSGYFFNPEILVQELKKQNLDNANVYCTLQMLHLGCSARLQFNRFINTSKDKVPTTSDNDIVMYKYIPIDLDPVRPTGISSTEEELNGAYELSTQIEAYMKEQGFKNHIRAFSGNGYHLLYPCKIENNEEGRDKVRNYLNRLDELFSNDDCHVDTTLFNPARVIKLYGTLAQKGRDTEQRPHRMSEIKGVVNEAD
ncbi:MAG: hypothetical protein K5868_06420 [Lachnospiraceae bacterium]|nr:hypothetical protein [Lachnospiraceae bacterium]